MRNKKAIASIMIMMVIALAVIVVADYNKHVDEKYIVDIKEWKDEYPEIYQSYMANAEMSQTKYGGSVPVDYLEEHPNLTTFYDGFGFSKEYLRARGHVYALEDIINTARPKGGASCLSCKSADFHLAINDDVTVNAMDFDQFLEEHPETRVLSCYDCHRNEPGTINITRKHLNTGLSNLDFEVSPTNQVCAQCHTEYYQEPVNKEVVLPWQNGLGTDGMLDYYDNVEFSDWEHPTTGASLLKAQHPELETFMGSIHDKAGVSCTDCHMPEIVGEDNLKSHHWTSPLKSPEGISASCMTCHTENYDELVERVEDVQGQVYEKTNEVSNELLDFIERLSTAVNNEAIEDEDLESLRNIHRRAQFKWDFVFVENGEGFHNSEKMHGDLDSARKLIKDGNVILGEYGY